MASQSNAGAEAVRSNVDPRVAWVTAQLASTFRGIKVERLNKFLDGDEFRQVVQEFCSSADRRTMFFFEKGPALLASLDPPRDIKSATLYFVKLRPVAVLPHALPDQVLVGVLTTPIAALASLSRSVYMALLSHPSTQRNWSEVVAKEVMQNTHGFIAKTVITQGEMEGDTCLPMPTSVDPRTAGSHQDQVHLLEGCIITWTKQIKSVLKQDPERLLLHGHPGPLIELEFWDAKARNLNSIFTQLQSQDVRQVLLFLDASNSTYNTSFAALCREVFHARTEANDNCKYLAPLRKWLVQLEEESEFSRVVDVFRPIMHTLLLIWKHSRFYNTPARLVVIIREICNALVKHGRAFASGSRIFELVEEEAAAEAVNVLSTAIRVLGALKTAYFDYKAKSNTECPDNPWRVQKSVLFGRLTTFLDRCHDMRDFCVTVVQFANLGRVEVGGTKGKTLSNSVQQIYADFQGAVAAFRAVPYDVMDIDIKGFDDDFYLFRTRIKELESRLASVLSQGFDDIQTIIGRFKLLDSFEALLERTALKDELERRQYDLLAAYAEDLTSVQAMFSERKEHPPIAHNLPPIAGALSWCRGLLERVQVPMEQLKALNRAILDSDEAKEIVKVYTSLLALLAEYEHDRIEEWGRHIEASSQAKLKLPLLVSSKATDGNVLLQVNFDPTLVRLLREVKYFLLLGLRVPESALAVFKKAETFRKHTGNLELIVNMYNSIQTQMLPVERPLMAPYMTKVETSLAPGLKTLNWKSHGTDVFITECMNAVKHASELLTGMTDNLAEIQRILNSWCETPLITRRAKPLACDAFDALVKQGGAARYKTMQEDGRNIAKALKETNKLLRVSQGMTDWKTYVDFVSCIVIAGLQKVVVFCLQHLDEQISAECLARDSRPPVLEIELDLANKEVRFAPAVGTTPDATGVRDRVMGWVDAVFRLATMFTRLDDPRGSYLREVTSDPGVCMLLASLNGHIELVEAQCSDLQGKFIKYKHLWTTDVAASFAVFIKQAHRVPLQPFVLQDNQDPDDPKVVEAQRAWYAAQEAALIAQEEAGIIAPFVGATTRRLDLVAFEQRIVHFRDLQNEIGDLKSSSDLGFVRVNAQPIKQTLSTWVTKWVYQYTSYLQDNVVGSLRWLQNFIQRIESGLSEEVPTTREGLMEAMGLIRDVRRVMTDTAAMFGPLRETVQMLKGQGIVLPDVKIAGLPAAAFLEQASLRWDNMLNLTFKVKEAIRPHQNQMADNIKTDIAAFRTRVDKFRTDFTARAPFSAKHHSSPDDAYAAIDSYYGAMRALRDEARALNEVEELFELARSQYDSLDDTAHELADLKAGWDLTCLYESVYSAWAATLWDHIYADEMLDGTRRLQAQIKAMSPQLRSWDIMVQLDARLKVLTVVLPLVVDLHSPDLQERHWKSLVAVTHTRLDKGPDFCLQDVLSMNLHQHVSDVQDIIEIAGKEAKIDGRLRTIENLWRDHALRFVGYKDVDMRVIAGTDEVVEVLEEHMMQLQTMMGMGKFVEFFKDRVAKWQSDLSSVETTIMLWLTVQRQWMSLESIFLGSKDIRAQLPEDSKRFEAIDTEFKDLMKEAETDANTLRACTVDGRADRLAGMVTQLEKCEKALNEYLDMKKTAFPRFYFVANAALLDILANGNDPPHIMQHLGDCFDAIANLELTSSQPPAPPPPPPADPSEPAPPPPPPPPKDRATAMIAKDGEIVSFQAPYQLVGAVEQWLSSLILVMQDTLKHELDASLDAASAWESDNPRENWLFAFPAQIVLLASQVFWTEETEAALEEVEGGQDDALSKYLNVCVARLEALILQVLRPLDPAARAKIISLITIDVHNRDVVQALVAKRTSAPTEFLWQSQLRYYYQEVNRDTIIKICDFRSWYCYEYIGNCGRLVITPLTDRCYITLTMAMRLMLGGAPAGPAGTGKTETTKDLARGLGLPCYVFNCSDQMNYQTMADIFKGLSQTGAWGCFDEFNRIPIEVLSVVATQVETVLAAIRWLSLKAHRPAACQELPEGRPPAAVGMFDFMGQEIWLVPTVGFFITMNPGYAGRTELPENLKALFRSCAMIRPDLALICENMLMSEGFVSARPLSIKFVTLYQLASELLSPQPHYDWGLRAVKAVLRVAGVLRRQEPDQAEDAVLMRALRDFNAPKIVARDMPIFLRLVTDLFPGLEVDSKVNEALRATATTICKQQGLQAEDVFLLKIDQFSELLSIRHSVMLVGPAGSGKTTVWRTYAACLNYEQAKPVCAFETVNPKAVTSDELYGFMTLSKEWKDGVLSIIMRNMSKNRAPFATYHAAKWVVLDGDIDAEWIESMNTVMDDNKVLTLVSNERIPLSASMRMVFEIASLANATPATVSRAGILFLNDADIGWRPVVESWIAARREDKERQLLVNLFRKYLEPALAMYKEGPLPTATPMSEIAMVCGLCSLLEGGLGFISSPVKHGYNPADFLFTPAAWSPDYVEAIFIWCVAWAIGGCLLPDARVKFSDRWKAVFKTGIHFPEAATVFDYTFVVKSDGVVEAVKWADRVPEYAPMTESVFSNIMVSTAETVRLTHLLQLCIDRRHEVLLIGPAGTGKTCIVRQVLNNLDDSFNHSTINLNYYTDAKSLQRQLEEPIDKRSGRMYGPPGNKRHVYFVDDLNMPEVEKYGTQTPIALLRQFADYSSWFDRENLGLKRDIRDVQLLAAMNPKAGSFTINPRLARHFVAISVQMPSSEDLKAIYQSIMDAHMVNGFNTGCVAAGTEIVRASIELIQTVASSFLPSAIKFHYNFNMRDMANIFQGVTHSESSSYIKPMQLARLWVHECYRVFADRLVSDKDMDRFRNIIVEVSKKYFDLDSEELHNPPPLFTSFMSSGGGEGESSYVEVSSKDRLVATLRSRLKEYNEQFSVMELVLFDQAVAHVVRIARILRNPRGHALLVGVGGSGKQSLCRLAAFMCGFGVTTLSVSGSFGIPELKEALKDMYRRSGVKPGEPLVFMMTDSHVTDERFLVYINDLLSSGVIPDLFTQDEFDSMFASLRVEAKAAGIVDNRPSMMAFFLERVRANLHVALCFSPVGDTLRVRARKFPALINATVIDWFHPWAPEALASVANTFLQRLALGGDDIRENIAVHMAEVHQSVVNTSIAFQQQCKRANYTTPKSFLEFIALYQSLLAERRAEVQRLIDRLQTGLSTLQRTAKDVESLQYDLNATMVRVEEKKAATDALLEQMGKQRGEAEQQQAVAQVEQAKADAAAREASQIEAQASGELAKARPALEQAKNAVDCLSKASLTELKSLANPPAGVDMVTKAVLMMLRDERKNFSWENAKKMMAKVDTFKSQLESFDAENMAEDLVERLEPIVNDQAFNPERMVAKSVAAANLANWAMNIVMYNKIYKKVAPLMQRLEVAKADKAAAEASLAIVERKVAEVEARLSTLQAAFLEATNEKAKVEAEAAFCNNRLSLAERLVNGLASENARWGTEIAQLRERDVTLVGDVLLGAAFGSYVGAFDSQFRDKMWRNEWLPDLLSREIPVSRGVDPLSVIATDAQVADWLNHGLPTDRKSLENGAITRASKRWPLMIDPQLQGIKWLRIQEESAAGGGVLVLRLSQRNWLKSLMAAVPAGQPVIIENLGETVDAVLDPLLSRAYVRTGNTLFLRIGSEEVEVDPRFRLYLQTKLANPHFKPELQAQCTVVNFIVTPKGLEEQLLAQVVSKEQPQLEIDMRELQQALNQYKIQLMELEDQLLTRLANAPADILSDVALIEGLEATKAKAVDISDAVERGKQTSTGIQEARNVYRSVALEAARLYFQIIELCNIDHMYQFSLDSFVNFFFKAMRVAPPSNVAEERVVALQQSIREVIYTWISRGLFEEHKMIFLCMLTFELLRAGSIGEDTGFSPEHLDLLIRAPTQEGEANEVAWLPNSAWASLCALSQVSPFEALLGDVVANGPRFLEWYNHSSPESEKLPLDWRELDKQPFLKLLVVRTLRPDRMIVALANFAAMVLPNGSRFTECDAQLNSFQILQQSVEDTSPSVPLYFVLSPGADVVADVDRLARAAGLEKGVSYHNISLGQGQDVVAMECLRVASASGHWVLLNNVHLMPRWLIELDKLLDSYTVEGTHPFFRLFLSSDPSPNIPISLLSRSVKLTNQPPSGLKANLKRAFCSFSAEEIEEMDSRTRGILFGLCHFHAVMLERKKFGSKGFNMMYPFAGGDLLASAIVLRNYMEAAAGIPWEDLRYLFGEIMYGGHIVNDFDREVCNEYLRYFMRDELLDELEMFPYLPVDKVGKIGFKAPSPTSYDQYLERINTGLPADTPLAFGLHPNTEIGFRTDASRKLFGTILQLLPQTAGDGESGQSMQHVAAGLMQDLLEEYRDFGFNIAGIRQLMDEPGPFQTVFLQECEAMNALVKGIVKSLTELDLGLKGELTMTSAMEALMVSLFNDRVPTAWVKLSFASLKPLAAWLVNLQARAEMLTEWTDNPQEVPMVAWIGGFFNPQSFLTAIMQTAAQQNGLELDKLSILTDVTKREKDEIEHASRDGAYITGLYLEGARWDGPNGTLEEARPREMFCPMPIINCKAALPLSDRAASSVSRIPVYKTQQRGPTYVFTAQLKTKVPSAKWVLAGAVLLMEIV